MPYTFESGIYYCDACDIQVDPSSPSPIMDYQELCYYERSEHCDCCGTMLDEGLCTHERPEMDEDMDEVPDLVDDTTTLAASEGDEPINIPPAETILRGLIADFSSETDELAPSEVSDDDIIFVKEIILVE